MNIKTVKALYALLKELYKSPEAKEFVDAYEHEELEQRHEAQKRELSYEDFECLLNLAEAVRRKLLPDKVCDEEKHESPKPKVEEPKEGEVYRDIFGNRYHVVGVDTMNYGNRFMVRLQNEFFVLRTIPLEDFMNPTFKKV